MAIQRIQRFGKFSPLPIDESRSRKMEELAGFARGITNTARIFAEEKAAREAPEEAIADVQKAEETGEEIKLRGAFERGAEIYNATLEQAYVNSKELSFAQADAKLSIEFKNLPKKNLTEICLASFSKSDAACKFADDLACFPSISKRLNLLLKFAILTPVLSPINLDVSKAILDGVPSAFIPEVDNATIFAACIAFNSSCRFNSSVCAANFSSSALRSNASC